MPANAEKELGFPYWLIRVWNIARNTGARLLFYGTDATLHYLKEIQAKHPIDATFHEFSDWTDFLILSRELKSNDNLFVVMSRKKFPSFNVHMARIPFYLNKYFQGDNFILIYPMQLGVSEESDLLRNNFIPEMLQEQTNDIGKTISRLFNRK